MISKQKVYCHSQVRHAPTAIDIVKFIKSHPTKASLEEVIEYIKKNFETDKKWEKLMRKYWDKVKLFI